MSIFTFYVLGQRRILENLRHELLSCMGGSGIPSLATLEQLPYLSATISETLRHSFGPASRLVRIHRDEAAVLEVRWAGGGKENTVEHVVPAGYAISMSSFLLHMNAEIFPNAEEFVPERWLDREGRKRKDLDKYLVSFSRGTRMCFGIK